MVQNKLRQPINIFLVEDNAFDAHLAEVALKETGVDFRLWVAEDGESALEELSQREQNNCDSRPDVILLDLNLPRKSGIEVLADLKANPNLRNIPTIILTTSQSDDDVLRSYDLHVNCFITKPMDIRDFIAVMRSIVDFWTRVVVLPKKAV